MRLVSVTYAELVNRGVSPRFAQILADPNGYHPDLSILIGKTDWEYFIPDGATDVVPLWDSNADSYVRWDRNGATEFVWLLHDDPNWTLMAESEQGIMAELWRSWTEFQETDDECRRFADAIGFRYCDEALRLLELDYDQFMDWKRCLRD